jgi:hypothetical protein
VNLSLNNEINFANDMDNTNEIEMFSPEEMLSPFEEHQGLVPVSYYSILVKMPRDR